MIIMMMMMMTDRILYASTLCSLLARVDSLRSFCLVSKSYHRNNLHHYCHHYHGHHQSSSSRLLSYLSVLALSHRFLARLLQLQSIVVVCFRVAFLKLNWFSNFVSDAEFSNVNLEFCLRIVEGLHTLASIVNGQSLHQAFLEVWVD